MASKISVFFHILCILFSFQGAVYICKSSVFVRMYLPFFHSITVRVFGQSPPDEICQVLWMFFNPYHKRWVTVQVIQTVATDVNSAPDQIKGHPIPPDVSDVLLSKRQFYWPCAIQPRNLNCPTRFLSTCAWPDSSSLAAADSSAVAEFVCTTLEI